MRRSLLAISLLSFGFSPLLAQISITTKSLPNGSLSSLYYQELHYAAVLPATQWSVVLGTGSLPPGLVLSTAASSIGLLDGIPTTPGEYTFTLQVQETTGAMAQQAYSITIAAITVNTYLPTNVVLSPYSAQLTATGGSGGPYQWTYFVNGQQTNSFELSIGGGTTITPFTGTNDGLITGIVKLEVGPSFVAFDAVAFDPLTQQKSLPTELFIPLTTCLVTESPGPVPDAEVGQSYFHKLSYTTPVPDPTQNFCVSDMYSETSVGADNLPPGMTFDSEGNLVGTPQIAGKYQMEGYAYFSGSTPTSVWSATGTFPLSLTVLPPPSIATAPILPPGLVGVPYSPFQFDLTGGTPPYRLSASGVPPGMLVTGAGVLYGTPTSSGVFSIGIGITDSLGVQAQTFPQNFQITITSATPQLQVPVSTLTFTAAPGGDAPPSQTIDVTPVADAALPDVFQVLIDGGQDNTPAPSWLTTNATTASAPSRIVVNVNQTNLATGNYSGRIQTVDSNGIRSSIPVLLAVTNANPKLTASPAILHFTARADNAETLVQNVILDNAGGGGPLSFRGSVAGSSSWISIPTPSPAQTTPNSPVFLQLHVNSQGLQPGAYHDTIQVGSSAGDVSIPVSLFVASSGPALALNTPGISFHASQNTGAPATRNIEILNVGDPGSTVNWTATLVTGSNWLSLVSPSGTATAATPGALTLALASGATQLAPGQYYALVKISDPNSLNSVQFVTATLNLESSSVPLLPDFAPAGLVFIAPAATATPTQQIQLNGGNGTALQAATSTADNGTWLSAQLSPNALSVSADPASLAAGIYTGSVTISVDEALRSVNVTLVVQPATVSTGNCTPTKVALTEFGLGNDFDLTSGLPVVLNVQLNDDCGSLVLNGNVVASFSNGDPALQLVGDSLGNYSTTWAPSAVTPEMVVILNATSGALQPAADKLYGGIAQNQTPPPTLAQGGTLNNLNPVVGAALAPGLVAQVYGSGLAPSPASINVLPLPKLFDNTFAQVGDHQAPFYFLSSGQVNIQLPSELELTAPPPQQIPIVLSVNNALTTSVLLDIVPTAPGVLSSFDGPSPQIPQNGAHIIAQHSDYTLVSSKSPAKPSEYLMMYLVGLGATNPSVASGMPAPSTTLAKVTNAPTVTVDKLPAKVIFAGLTPGFVGLYQINFQVPAGASSGEVEVDVTQNGVAANPTMLAVSQ